MMMDCGPDDIGVPRHPESIPRSEEAMVTSLCHRLRLLGGWEGQEEKRGLGGAGTGSHTGTQRDGERSEMLLKSGPGILQPKCPFPNSHPKAC